MRSKNKICNLLTITNDKILLFLRLFFPLLVVLGLFAYALVPLVYYLTSQWFVKDLDLRSELISNTLQESVSKALAVENQQGRKEIFEILTRVTRDERLFAMGVCSPEGTLIIKTELFPENIGCTDVLGLLPYRGIIKHLSHGDVHIARGTIESIFETFGPPPLEPKPPLPAKDSSISSKTKLIGNLIILHDMSFIQARGKNTEFYIFVFFLSIASVTAFTTLIVSRWSQKTWMTTIRTIVGGVRESGLKFRTQHRDFSPFLSDLHSLVRKYESAERSNEDLERYWDATKIKEILNRDLSGNEVIVVSNRQPYAHNYSNGKIEVSSPASGLVTAVEPILRACSGVWIAHGNGSADKDVVDMFGRIKVPPGSGEYEIHRIWLTTEEENGYYSGFSNEGLWPLCHNAHIRPIFRREDWLQYSSVNRKFCDAVVSDSTTAEPVVLVQDFHLSLLPGLIRKSLPGATVITFWHIPWPNPETFGICPWQKEILSGLLGSSILGFHTQFCVNNFLDCVDRFLESRIDRETNTVSYKGHLSEIRAYPISIEWQSSRMLQVPPVPECEEYVRKKEKIPKNVRIAIGVDRLDYTKGIIERFRAVEKLLESNPSYRDNFTLIQIAAPTRSGVAAYRNFADEVIEVSKEINRAYGSEKYQPIILKIEHHNQDEVFKYYRAADACLVTSLSDGMNLVAKEFVAARDDEAGVLILSMFTGASKELFESLIVNPYDIEQTANALLRALEMPRPEQRARIHAMRSILMDYNVYKWAGRMLLDAARIRRRNQFFEEFNKEVDIQQ